MCDHVQFIEVMAGEMLRNSFLEVEVYKMRRRHNGVS